MTEHEEKQYLNLCEKILDQGKIQIFEKFSEILKIYLKEQEKVTEPEREHFPCLVPKCVSI